MSHIWRGDSRHLGFCWSDISSVRKCSQARERNLFMNTNTNLSTKDTAYHKERLRYTEILYETPGMLPRRYVFVLTNLCNLRCSFCFQVRRRIEGSMTTEDWLHVVEQLPSYAVVTLTGGEPFVFKGFEEVFKAVASRYPCNIISNGLLLTEDIIELLLAYDNFKVLSISVDDIGNVVRDVKPKQWKRVEEMMRHFAKRRNELQSDTLLDAKTIVLDQNAQSLLDIHRYCMETLHCDTHSFQFLKGSPMQHADFMFPMEDMFKTWEAPVYEKWETICQQMELVRQYNLQHNKVCYSHPKLFDLNSETLIWNNHSSFANVKQFVKDNYLSCKAPWESVHINVDGNLFPCMAIKMGNVKEQSLQDIIAGEVFNRFRDVIRAEGTVEGCNRCGYLCPKEHLFV